MPVIGKNYLGLYFYVPNTIDLINCSEIERFALSFTMGYYIKPPEFDTIEKDKRVTIT